MSSGRFPTKTRSLPSACLGVAMGCVLTPTLMVAPWQVDPFMARAFCIACGVYLTVTSLKLVNSRLFESCFEPSRHHHVSCEELRSVPNVMCRMPTRNTAFGPSVRFAPSRANTMRFSSPKRCTEAPPNPKYPSDAHLSEPHLVFLEGAQNGLPIVHRTRFSELVVHGGDATA
eukprot:392943-Prorocentrum_minimum.AAC.2